MDMFKKITFVRFCFASAAKLPGDLGLPTEKVICLYKECIEMAKHCNDISMMMNCCMKFVLHSNSIGRHADSLRCLKEILPSTVVKPSCELIVHKYLSLIYRELKEFDNVVLHAKKLIEIARNTGDKESESGGNLLMGNAFLFLACYDDAIDCSKRCLEIAREIKHRVSEVPAYLLMGQINTALSDYDNAIIYCKKCIELAITIGDKHAEASAYSSLGNVYYSLRKYDDAISNCNKCIHIHKEDKPCVASAYLTLGKVNQSLDKYDEAIQNYKHYIDIVNHFDGEERAVGAACLHLGVIYKTLGDYNEAIQYGKKCLDISQETNDKKTELQVHHLLAEVYRSLMQLNNACLSIDAGMAIATEFGNKDDEKFFKAAHYNVYAVVGLLDKANACDEPLFKQLLKLPTCSEDNLIEDLTQAVKTGDKRIKQKAYMRLLRFYISNKDCEKAINCLEQLKEIDVDRWSNLFCITEIGKLYRLMGQNDMALRCFKEGLSTAESCSDNMLRSKFYYGIGKSLFLSSEELNLAERYLREAIRCFEAIFSSLGSRDEFKISIFDKYIDSYKVLAILLIKGKQIEEALLVLDRCRARALKDLLISNFKMEQEGSNDEHLEYSDVLSLVSTNGFIISYSLCFDIFLKFFPGGQTNRSFSICPNYFLQIDVDKLFDEMGVVEVVKCEDRSLDKERDIQTEQNRSKEEYKGLHQQTASLLNVDSERGESNEDSAETKGSTLEVLFRILECDRILLSKEDEVVVIPEGPLYQVPFPALQDPHTGKYLSETKRIRLAPSLATLKHFEDFPTDRTSNAEPLIIGSPLVGKVMMDGEERDIEPLIGALDEAIDIANILGVGPLLVADATKPAVLEKLQQGVSIVHIAAHGMLSKATIVLAPSPEIRATKIPEEEDYMLTMADVQKAQVRAQLVVLSCCHSGRGEIRAEGVVGMCRAFLASGARAVVASLWAIDDDATYEFMQNFYLSLKDGNSASASLQEAMKEMRNTSNYSKPKYWAPFFVMGENVTIKF